MTLKLDLRSHASRDVRRKQDGPRRTSTIVACRTEALGGHMEACDDCGMTRIAYNSGVGIVRSVRGEPELRIVAALQNLVWRRLDRFLMVVAEKIIGSYSRRATGSARARSEPTHRSDR
jgi:Transposase zinc-binding domain